MKKRPVVIGVINQKGGAGKSTVAILLSRKFGHLGYKVLAIDADSQMSLSCGLDVVPSMDVDIEASLGNYLRTRAGADNGSRKRQVFDLSETIVGTPDGLVDVIPSDGHFDAEAVEAEHGPRGSKFLFRDEVVAKIDSSYDVVFVDGAGKSGWVTASVMNACDFFIVPTGFSEKDEGPARNTVEALSLLCKLDGVDPEDRIGVLLNDVTPSTKIGRAKLPIYQELFGPLLFESRIHHRTAPLEDSEVYRQDIWDRADANPKAARSNKLLREEFDAVATELIERIDLNG